MKDEEREPFTRMAQQDQKRFEEEMKEWREKGYYTLTDGSKSKDRSAVGKEINWEATESFLEEPEEQKAFGEAGRAKTGIWGNNPLDI